MKGIVFTEFFEMVEHQWNYDVVDKIIEKSAIKNNGAYTAVGTYDHQELGRLIGSLSQVVDKPADIILKDFGEYLFSRFVVLYPVFFDKCPGCLDFLSKIEDVIHTEVKKLYPEAELPKFIIKKINDQHLLMYYHSEKRLENFALGLITGCIDHFQENIQVIKKATESPNETLFEILKND